MANSYNKKLDEYDWEREIRKDEERIHKYMNELDHYIDLPGEEDLILNKLMMKTEVIPQNQNMDDISFSDIFNDFDEDFFNGEDWKKKEGADIYILIEESASKWCSTFASKVEPYAMAEGMKIICRFGRMLARCADIMDIGPGQFPALKTALCKRLAREASILIGEFDHINSLQKKLRLHIEDHKAHLQSIREKLIDLMEKSR